MSARRRVVVTGMGLVTPAAQDAAGLHEAACRGALAGDRRPELAFDGMPGPLAAPYDAFDARDELGGNLRPLDRTGRLAAVAARRALADSGWSPEALARHEVGLVLGTLFGSLRTITEFDRRGVTAGPSYAKPMAFANSVINAAAGQTAIRFDLRGVNATVSGDLTAGLQALGYAADLIRTGRASAVLAGGAEELCVESLYGFHKLGLLCRDNLDRALPCSTEPTGAVLSEAGALLMLESLESARERGATVFAEILGYASTFDPARGSDHATAVEGVASAVRGALADAERLADTVHCLSLGANGSSLDRLETEGVGRVVPAAGSVPALASKAVAGETLGAAGAIQTVLALSSLRSGRIPGVPGLPEVERNGVPRPRPAVEPLSGSLALMTSVGLQGRTTALLAEAS